MNIRVSQSIFLLSLLAKTTSNCLTTYDIVPDMFEELNLDYWFFPYTRGWQIAIVCVHALITLISRLESIPSAKSQAEEGSGSSAQRAPARSGSATESSDQAHGLERLLKSVYVLSLVNTGSIFVLGWYGLSATEKETKHFALWPDAFAAALACGVSTTYLYHSANGHVRGWLHNIPELKKRLLEQLNTKRELVLATLIGLVHAGYTYTLLEHAQALFGNKTNPHLAIALFSYVLKPLLTFTDFAYNATKALPPPPKQGASTALINNGNNRQASWVSLVNKLSSARKTIVLPLLGFEMLTTFAGFTYSSDTFLQYCHLEVKGIRLPLSLLFASLGTYAHLNFSGKRFIKCLTPSLKTFG